MIDELESKLWYQELKDKVDDSILVYQDKRGYLWDKVNPEYSALLQKQLLWLSFYKPLSIRVDDNVQSKLGP